MKTITYTAPKLLRTWADTAVLSQPLKRTNGSALMTRMVASALEARVRVWTITPVEDLVTNDDGAVTGAVIGGARGSSSGTARCGAGRRQY
ncbi:FAD-binding protein [Citricoccus sp. NPDC055426]|uniref:FAD-binding protein n=1 Tax=Citricoccus sp. NPDC055426 TaxID=3155536 RepID=UPI00342A705E